MTMTALHLYLHILPALVIFNIATSFSPFIKPDNAHGRICRESGNCPLHMTQFDVETKRELYNIENSSWTSPQWNWGSAIGTGHDCAAICRRRWSDKTDRQKLVNSLLNPAGYHSKHHDYEIPFEEIKLILGLLWQRSGRSHSYNQVLENMARAGRYEENDEMLSAFNFITDVRDAFAGVALSKSDKDHMDSVAGEIQQYHSDPLVNREDVFRIRRICCGMVLEAMGFIERGI